MIHPFLILGTALFYFTTSLNVVSHRPSDSCHNLQTGASSHHMQWIHFSMCTVLDLFPSKYDPLQVFYASPYKTVGMDTTILWIDLMNALYARSLTSRSLSSSRPRCCINDVWLRGSETTECHSSGWLSTLSSLNFQTCHLKATR